MRRHTFYSLVVCAVCLLLCHIPSSASAQEKYTEMDFTYVVALDQAAIIDYCGSVVDLVIPDTLGGFPVTRICMSAFQNCKALKTVTIPSGIVSIGESVPDENGYIAPLEDFDPVPVIGWRCGTMNLRQAANRAVFDHCPSLTDIYLPENIETIYKYAFFNCTATIHYEADSLTAQAIEKSKERTLRNPKPTRTPRKASVTPAPIFAPHGI